MTQPDCQPFDIEGRIRSESVLLALFAPHDAHGITVRLCRYPDAGVAWVWAQIVLPDGAALGYNVDHLACGGDPVDVDAPDAVYAVTDSPVTMARRGPRDALAGAALDATLPMHAGTLAPDAPGETTVRIHADFEPFPGASGGTLRGRSELHGRVRATVTVNGTTTDLAGVGQWHEQLQDAPRFRLPFTYACLVGERVSLVALAGPAAGRGWVRDESGIRTLRDVRIEAGEDTRTIACTDEAGTSTSIRAHVRHRSTIPLYGRPWHGTRVVADTADGRLAGMVNTFDPAERPLPV